MLYWLLPIIIIFFTIVAASFLYRKTAVNRPLIILVVLLIPVYSFIISYGGFKAENDDNKFDAGCASMQGIVSQSGLCFLNNKVVPVDGEWVRP